MFIIDRDTTIDLRFRPSSRPWTSRRETKYGLAEARPSEAMAAPAGFATASRSRRLQRVLQPAASQVGLGRLTWHQFRHIHSSLLNDLTSVDLRMASASSPPRIFSEFKASAAMNAVRR